MEVEIFCLCDYAYLDSAKKLNVKGAFDRIYAEELPADKTFFIALRMRFNREEIHTHQFQIELKKTTAKSPLAYFKGEIPLEEPKEDKDSVIANEPFKLPIKFNEEGNYKITLFIEGNKIISLPLLLVKKKNDLPKGPYPEGHQHVIKKVQTLRDKLSDNVQSIKESQKGWNENSDIRITTFSRLINNVNSAQLALIFSGKHLSHKYWWEETVKDNLEEDAKKLHAQEYDTFYKVGFIQLIFSNIETGFRNILKAIDPKACNEGTDPFKKIYDHLLKTRLSKSYETEILDLLRLIRNTIHNNGFYFPRSGKDQKITYKETEYNFTVGEQVNFVDWNFILSLSNDIADLLHKMMTDPIVSSIEKEITDPSSMS